MGLYLYLIYKMRSAEAKSLTIQLKANKATASWHIPDIIHITNSVPRHHSASDSL